MTIGERMGRLVKGLLSTVAVLLMIVLLAAMLYIVYISLTTEVEWRHR